MLKEQERKEENLMKFSFIQGCKKKFFQSRNICAQIGSSNRACVCVCVCVCVYMQGKKIWGREKMQSVPSGVMDCQGMGEKPMGL